MQCYACDQEAAQRCPRCGKPYCRDHGADFCAHCLHPASIAPSATVFRGSLLALLIGSVLALWLLIRPPGLPGEPGPVVAPLPTQELQPSPTPISTPIPTPLPTATPSPTPAPTPPPFETYIVQEGDALFDIALQFGVTLEDIIAANNIADPTLIQPGQELKIPRPAPTPTPAPTP